MLSNNSNGSSHNSRGREHPTLQLSSDPVPSSSSERKISAPATAVASVSSSASTVIEKCAKSSFVQHFNRGHKASVSVRLRQKKSADQLAEKKKTRHSGDFSFFAPALALGGGGGGSGVNSGNGKMDSGPEEEDWSYITFPNGVATVQELKTNGNGEPTRTPVKVVTRKVPGLSLHENLFNGPPTTLGPADKSPTNPRASNGNFGGVALNGMGNNKRQSCDFGALKSNESSLNNNGSSTGNVAVGGRHQRLFAPNNRRQSMDVTSALLSGSSPSASPRNQYRRRSEQHHRSSHQPVAAAATISKRCSGEFQFIKSSTPPTATTSPAEAAIAARLGSSGASSSSTGAVSRVPTAGLGRRAATQLNINMNKKNSYNKAMYKSHDNLVKVGTCLLIVIKTKKQKITQHVSSI